MTIHMILQGKGGVGKSFVASLIAQYVRDELGLKPACYDTDPVNATFAGYQDFQVETIALMQPTERDIDPRRFDTLVEKITSLGTGETIVIDNGASTFLPLADYLLTSDVPSLFRDLGHQMVLHSVITGGQSQDDTLQGLLSLLQQFDVPICVWLNPFHGRIHKDGKRFQQLKIYQQHQERIAGVVEIPEFNPKTTGVDLAELLKARKPFREAIADTTVSVMVRQRLKMAQRELYAQIAQAGVL